MKDSEKAALQGRIRGLERLIACLLASLEPKQYEKIKSLLEGMHFDAPKTPWHAIETPESIRACRNVCTYAESTRPILDASEELGL